MIETKDITKMVGHIIRRDKGIADPQLMHPPREWLTGLGITTLIVLFGSWFCWHMYTQYSQIINTPLTVSESGVPYQATTIAEAIKIFETKQLKFSEILGVTSETHAIEVSKSTELISETDDAPVATSTVGSDTQVEFIDTEDTEAIMAL